VFLWRFRPAVAVELDRQVTIDLGPNVADQIALARRERLHCRMVEIHLPFALPAGLQRFHPFRFGDRVLALIDRRCRALQHIELPGMLAEERDSLDSRSAGSDDSDALVP